MNTDEAISLIKNTAFLGYNGDDDKMAEAIQAIEQLVGKIEQLEEAVGRMAIELASVKKERDAAVADLKTVCDYFEKCTACKLYQDGKCSSDEYRNICSKNNSKWEWRGIDG